MRTKGILLLMLLLLAVAGDRSGQAAGLSIRSDRAADVERGYVALPVADNIVIDCNSPALPSGFTFEVLPQASGAQAQTGNVLHTFLCNYNVKSQAGQPSGMAITIDYNCPADTQNNWATRTSPRSNEVSRTSSSLLTRETGSVTGFAGTFSVQEKLFLLIDSHTIATIVVLTDPDPSNPSNDIFSAAQGQPAAVALAQAYAPQANDPACPAAQSLPSTSGGTSGSLLPVGEPWEWEHIDPSTAAMVAVGVGLVAALLGGLLTGAIGTSAVPVTAALATAPPATISPGSGALAPVVTAQPVAASNSIPSPPPPLPPTITAAPVEGMLAAGAATAGVVSSVAANSGEAEQSQDKQDEQDEVEKPCPEVQAQMFGLPGNNSRKDCPGSRPGMGPWCVGIDFTSNDERGTPAHLDFEALVAGEVTYLGDRNSFNMIEVKLENGHRIQYLHASAVYVHTGQHVTYSTKLGKTGGTGPQGPDQYEIHLHVQAIDHHGNLIDPDCALASMKARKLRTGASPSPYLERMEREERPERSERGAVASQTLTEEPGTETSARALPETQAVASSSSSAEQPNERPIFCANCGQANVRSGRFCFNCGSPLRHA